MEPSSAVHIQSWRQPSGPRVLYVCFEQQHQVWLRVFETFPALPVSKVRPPALVRRPIALTDGFWVCDTGPSRLCDFGACLFAVSEKLKQHAHGFVVLY